MCKNKAFTLIEVLVVLAIIGILFTTMASRFEMATNKAKECVVESDFRAYQLAGETLLMKGTPITVSAMNSMLNEKLSIVSNKSYGKDPYGENYSVEIAENSITIKSAGNDGSLYDGSKIVIGEDDYTLLINNDGTTSDGFKFEKKEAGFKEANCLSTCKMFKITVVNGVSDNSTAKVGDTITVTVSDDYLDKFEYWEIGDNIKIVSGSINETTMQFKMPQGDIVVSAKEKDDTIVFNYRK